MGNSGLSVKRDGPLFDGVTYDEKRDRTRLKGQLEAVRRVLADGSWWRLEDLKARVGANSDASVSARIRDLRKEKFGGYDIERKNLGGGVWVYRMKP